MSSLVATALRISARKALLGATIAKDRVHDSAISPIDHMVRDGKSEPFIVISSEDEETNVTNRDVTGGEGTIDLVLEIAIAQDVSVTPQAGEGEPTPPEIVIPATDGGFEISLSLIIRQINRALFEQQGEPWCDVFRTFCISVRKVTNRRGMGNKDGARFAARQLIFTIEGLREPAFGHVPTSDEAWGRFLDQMSADVELAPLIPAVKAVITGTPEIPEWDRGRSDQGLTDEVAAGIGLSGAGGFSTEGPPLTSEAELHEQ